MTIGLSINKCLHSNKPLWQNKARLTDPEVWAAATSKAWRNSGGASFSPAHSRRIRKISKGLGGSLPKDTTPNLSTHRSHKKINGPLVFCFPLCFLLSVFRFMFFPMFVWTSIIPLFTFLFPFSVFRCVFFFFFFFLLLSNVWLWFFLLLFCVSHLPFFWCVCSPFLLFSYAVIIKEEVHTDPFVFRVIYVIYHLALITFLPTEWSQKKSLHAIGYKNFKMWPV